MLSEKELIQSATVEYLSRFGHFPTVAAVAPGRVNLIGEHTDYNGGFVFPMAIERYTAIVGGPKQNEDRSAAETKTASIYSQVVNDEAVFSLDKMTEPKEKVDWTSYVQGSIVGCLEKGIEVPSFNAVIVSNVPLGGGLSSSASLEVAIATLLEGLSGKSLQPVEKALVCQAAEHRFARMPCGIMDQFIVTLAQKDHAMLLDCRNQKTFMIPMDDPDIVILVTNSNVKHELSGSEYPERRASCEKAAEILGVPLLRDTTLETLQESIEKFKALGDVGIRYYQRARHFLTEEQRTESLADALMRRNWKTVGQLMFAGHDSLRYDYEVSCPELDLLVQIVRSIGTRGGAIGSRMTGGGFGGCSVTLAAANRVAAIEERIETDYFAKTGIHPTMFVTRPAQGAHLASLP